MDPREFDELTRDAASTMTRREVLGLFARAFLAVTGFRRVRWLVKLDQEPESPVDERISLGCTPVDQEGACPAGWVKERIPGHVPTPNGCGGEGFTQYIVPDSFIRVNFTQACVGHDLCYADCEKTREECDSRFREDLMAECERAYPGFWGSVPRQVCYGLAGIYHVAVLWAGKRFWLASQKKGCQCCP